MPAPSVVTKFIVGDYGILSTMANDKIGWAISCRGRICAECKTSDLSNEVMNIRYFKKHIQPNDIPISLTMLDEMYCQKCLTKFLKYNKTQWKSLFSLRKMQNKFNKPDY